MRFPKLVGGLGFRGVRGSQYIIRIVVFAGLC